MSSLGTTDVPRELLDAVCMLTYYTYTYFVGLCVSANPRIYPVSVAVDTCDEIVTEYHYTQSSQPKNSLFPGCIAGNPLGGC